MGKIPVYRWNGEYFGFIYNSRLFNRGSDYLGWVDEENLVWRANGTFLGEIIQENYVLRKANSAPRAQRAIRAIPATPAIPALKSHRPAKPIKAGWLDALDEYKI